MSGTQLKVVKCREMCSPKSFSMGAFLITLEGETRIDLDRRTDGQ